MTFDLHAGRGPGNEARRNVRGGGGRGEGNMESSVGHERGRRVEGGRIIWRVVWVTREGGGWRGEGNMESSVGHERGRRWRGGG